MNTNEYKMLSELLKEASTILNECELTAGVCEGYRYALKDELYGYALTIDAEVEKTGEYFKK